MIADRTYSRAILPVLDWTVPLNY